MVGCTVVQTTHLTLACCCSEDTPDDNWREGVLAIRRLNEKLGRDARVTTVMINIGDGYTLATKL